MERKKDISAWRKYKDVDVIREYDKEPSFIESWNASVQKQKSDKQTYKNREKT